MAQVLCRGLKSQISQGKTSLGRIVICAGQSEGPFLSRPGPVIPAATLIATHGEKYPYAEPWDYKNKSFTQIHRYLDSSLARMNPNSKMIVVEGNVAVGKNEFAKRLAKNFDMLYVPSLPEKMCFVEHKNGYDKRNLNEALPEHIQFYDLEKFYSDPNPQRGAIGKLQLDWYKERFNHYCQAVLHLLSTGQWTSVCRQVSSSLHTFISGKRAAKYDDMIISQFVVLSAHAQKSDRSGQSYGRQTSEHADVK